MEKRESHNAETYLNIEALASGVQECRLAGVRSCGGGPYNQSAPTSLTHRLGWSECNILKLPDGPTIKFGTLNSAGDLE